MNVERGKGEHAENFFDAVDGKLNLLKTAAIYGANASGKTNVLLAFMALRWIVRESGDLKEEQSILPYEPFALDPTDRNSPIRFELEFVDHTSTRFVYAVAFTSERIVEESLFSFRSGQKAKIFLRGPDDDWRTIDFGSTYKGGAKRIPFFSNNSYLSKAGNSAASADVMKNVYRYFRSFNFLSQEKMFLGGYLKERNRLEYISKALKSVDTGIELISAEERSDFKGIFPDEMPESLKSVFIEEHKMQYSFWHKDSTGELVKFDEDDESSGTRRLFNILPIVIETLKRGSVLFMDEIETSFHPHIVDLIIRVFSDETVNTRRAQLIFTTHDISILDPSVFRRDQIWFVEKRSNASRLYSLDGYDKNKVRSGSPFGHWYGEGRFGALPRISYSEVVDAVKMAFETD